MNKFFVLSGALKNAGDFLIVDRTTKLLQECYPECEIIEYNRKEEMTNETIKLANSCDALIYAGGPSVKKNIYPDIVPLCPELDQIETKITSVGMGWGGNLYRQKDIRNYKLMPSSRLLFKRIENDSSAVSCRDWFTCQVLAENGIKSIMTGCPAWYNLEELKKPAGKKYRKEIKKIYISDPGNMAIYKEQCIDICRFVKQLFSDAEITFVFHRGVGKDRYTNSKQGNALELFISELDRIGIRYKDISYSVEGLKIYDDCDLHIGYRVHAHIFNLSKNTPSILIEEDARGGGVNDAFGLTHIRAYRNKIKEAISGKVLKIMVNPYITWELNNEIEKIFQTNGIKYDLVFDYIRESYAIMRDYISKIV